MYSHSDPEYLNPGCRSSCKYFKCEYDQEILNKLGLRSQLRIQGNVDVIQNDALFCI